VKVRSDIVSDNSGSDNVALTSVALRLSLKIPALINIGLTSTLCNNLTIPAAINVTDKCDLDIDSGSDKVQKAALTSAGSRYRASLLRSTYLSNLVYHGI
jgi:hypothetical protein